MFVLFSIPSSGFSFFVFFLHQLYTLIVDKRGWWLVSLGV